VLICKCHKLLTTLASVTPTRGLRQLTCSEGVTHTQVLNSMLHACYMLGRCFTSTIKVRGVQGVWASGPLILALIMGLAMTVASKQTNFRQAVLTMWCMSQPVVLMGFSAKQTTDLLTATQTPMSVLPVLVLAPNPEPNMVCSTTSSTISQGPFNKALSRAGRSNGTYPLTRPRLCTRARQQGRAGLCSKGCTRHGSHSRIFPVSITLSRAGLLSRALSKAGLLSRALSKAGLHSKALSRAGLHSRALSRPELPPLSLSHREAPIGWVRNATRRFWLASIFQMISSMPTKALLLRMLMLVQHTATYQVSFVRRKHECFAALCVTNAVRACMLSRVLSVVIAVEA